MFLETFLRMLDLSGALMVQTMHSPLLRPSRSITPFPGNSSILADATKTYTASKKQKGSRQLTNTSNIDKAVKCGLDAVRLLTFSVLVPAGNDWAMMAYMPPSWWLWPVETGMLGQLKSEDAQLYKRTTKARNVQAHISCMGFLVFYLFIYFLSTEDTGNLTCDWVFLNICRGWTSFSQPAGGSIIWMLPFLCLLGLKMP